MNANDFRIGEGVILWMDCRRLVKVSSYALRHLTTSNAFQAAIFSVTQKMDTVLQLIVVNLIHTLLFLGIEPTKASPLPIKDISFPAEMMAKLTEL